MDETFKAWPKHFVYLSPPKIDSLFGQIAAKDLKSIAKSVTVDLKVLKAEFGPAKAPPETVYSRLRVVLEYLDRRTMIGSIDEPGPYFAGRIPMRWGPYEQSEMFVRGGLVYFAGYTDKTTIGLGGSKEHMFGGPGDAPAYSYSLSFSLLTALNRDLGLDREPLDEGVRHDEPVRWASDTDQQLLAVSWATGGSRGTTELLEFVAKRLIWGEASDPQKRVILGTPLYVAAGD